MNLYIYIYMYMFIDINASIYVSRSGLYALVVSFIYPVYRSVLRMCSSGGMVDDYRIRRHLLCNCTSNQIIYSRAQFDSFAATSLSESSSISRPVPD